MLFAALADDGQRRHGPPARPVLRDETPALRDPRLLLYGLNLKATNGVIHTINRVLVPATP